MRWLAAVSAALLVVLGLGVGMAGGGEDCEPSWPTERECLSDDECVAQRGEGWFCNLQQEYLACNQTRTWATCQQR